MKIKIIIFTLLWGAFMQAQEKNEFTLQEAIDYALKNAYAVQTASDNIKLATNRVWETAAIGLPQIDGNIEYQNFLQQHVNKSSINLNPDKINYLLYQIILENFLVKIFSKI